MRFSLGSEFGLFIYLFFTATSLYTYCLLLFGQSLTLLAEMQPYIITSLFREVLIFLINGLTYLPI